MIILKIALYTTILLFFSACGDSDKTLYKPIAKIVKTTVYKVGIHPYQNSKQMYVSYRPILDFIENKIGNISLTLETSKNYAHYNKKLFRGDFDFSLPNPYQTYRALSYGYKVIGRMKPDSTFRGIFVARKDLKLKNVKQLIGKDVSFPAPTALAAAMMPLYYLYENGINVKKDINKKYVGSQYSSILNAYSSDTIAGATWPTSWEAWKKDNPDKKDTMEVVWKTKSLVNNGFIVKKIINKNVAKKIIDILVKLDTTPKGKKLLRNAGFDGFQYSNDDDFNIVQEFLDKFEKNIGFPK